MANLVEVSFPGGKRVTAKIGQFTIETDQPADQGGQGSAPSPFEVFAASLAACAGFYVLSFCQARQLPTEGMRLWQRLLYEERRLEAVELHIEVPASFPDRYRDALARVAEGCTVKRAIEAQPKFWVRVAAMPAASAA